MAALHLNALDLLGKQVSFTYSHPIGQLVKKGLVTSVLLNLSSSSQIRIDDESDFHNLSEITDFEIAP